MRGNPNSSGMKSSATNGRLRLAASQMRRAINPYWPPDMYCIMSSASDPIVKPRQKRNPISHDRRNWSTLKNAPRIPASRPQKPAIRPHRWSRARAGTSVVTACVSMRSVFLRRVLAPGGRLLNLGRVPSGHIRSGRVLAQLERTNVGNDRPSIARRDLRLVIRHHPESIGDDVEEIPHIRLPQAIDVVRRRLPIAALHDQPVAAAGAVVARTAVDVETLLSTVQHRFVDRKRQLFDRHLVDFAGEECLVVLERPACNRSLDQRPRAGAVGKKFARTQPSILRLVVHVLAARAE